MVNINQSLVSLLFQEKQISHRQNIRWPPFQPSDVPRGTPLFCRRIRLFSVNDPMAFQERFLFPAQKKDSRCSTWNIFAV